MSKMKKVFKIFVAIVLSLAVLLGGLSIYMTIYAGKYIVASHKGEDIGQEEKILPVQKLGKDGIEGRGVDCILVLGAAVKPNGMPSKMLQDRLDYGIELYKAGVSPVLLLSGDNGKVEYNEVLVMKNYALAQGVPEGAIFLDHAGFSTYESMYRAKEIFGAKKLVLVTQKYHIYRGIYIGRQLGMEVYGASADQKSYPGQMYRSLREVVARDKDFIKCIYKPEPTFLGEPISLEKK